ncbi:MAG: hypothetical protein IT435_02370 [Phycisphaerales bacterium]|nr:hypothetical protein [Phycisphaerales bacterium]
MEIGKTRLDMDAVRNGVWTEFVLPGVDGEPVEVSLRLALADAGVNTAYKEALKKSLEPFERLLALYKKGSDIPPALSKKINDVGRQVFVEQIVTDWKGPMKGDKPQPYSPEGCLALFNEYPELLAQAEGEATKFSRYRTAILEEAAGN